MSGKIVSTGQDFLDPFQFVPANNGLLVSLPLCAGIPFYLLEPFFLKCEFRRLNRGDILLSPGQINHHLYILLSGLLTIKFNSLGSSEKVFLVQPGEFVGEISIIDGLAPTAYVTASDDSLIIAIHKSVLWSDFFQIPGAAQNLLRQIAERFRARNAAMQKSLEQTLRLEYLERELRIAQDIQIGMLPCQPLLPDYPQIEVDALMQPAKEVGGDLYDAFPIDADKLCIAIGDVAGKGIPAALFMVRSLTLLRIEMMKTRDLKQTIEAMNELMSQDNPMCMFVTLTICIVDVSRGLLQFVNGGHNRPLFGNTGDGYHFLEQPKGILLGIKPDAVYQIAARKLNPGDMLILYTDGVTEAMNSAQQEFTEQGLLEFTNQKNEQSAKDMIIGIKNAVQDFVATAEQSDDLTLLALRYLGKHG